MWCKSRPAYQFPRFKRKGHPETNGSPPFSATATLPETSATDAAAITGQFPHQKLDAIKIDPLPDARGINDWQHTVKKAVAIAFNQNPHEAFAWFCEVDTAQHPESLRKPGNFAALDMKISNELVKVIKGELARSINTMEDNARQRGDMIGGREFAWHI